MSTFAVTIMLLVLGAAFLALGIGLFYAIGVCSRCGKWSMNYVCPECKRGRYDYTP